MPDRPVGRDCPFCGGLALLSWCFGDDYSVSCVNCDYGLDGFDSAEAAEEAWKNRPLEDRLTAERDAAREALREAKRRMMDWPGFSESIKILDQAAAKAGLAGCLECWGECKGHTDQEVSDE
jgi:hypothetical protein